MRVLTWVPSRAAPNYVAINGITTGAGATNAVFSTSTEHGFTTGDTIFFEPGSIQGARPTPAAWNAGTSYNKGMIVSANGYYVFIGTNGNSSTPNPQTDNNASNWTYLYNNIRIADVLGAQNFYSVTVIDSTHFTIGLDATTWGSYSSGGHVAWQMTFKAGDLPAVPVISSSAGLPYVSLYSKYLPNMTVYIYDATLGVLLGQEAFSPLSAGWPIELQVAFCNATNSNGWFCVPHLANCYGDGSDTSGTDYVSEMATYIKNNLTPGLVAYYELSNEVWGGNYQSNYAGAVGFTLWKNGTFTTIPINYTYVDYWYGWRIQAVMGRIKTIYSGNLSAVQCVMAEWGARGSAGTIDSTYSVIGGRHLATGTPNASPPPISYCDAIAISSYFEAPSENRFPVQMVWQFCYGGQQAMALATFDTYWRSTAGQYDTENLYCYLLRNFPNWWYVANGHTGNGSQVVKLIQYEGGPQGFGDKVYANLDAKAYNPGTGPVTITVQDCWSLLFGYFKSSYMQNILNASGSLSSVTTASMLQLFKSVGGTYPSCYPLVSQWTPMWGPIYPNEWGSRATTMLTAYKNFNATGNP